jgi:predicted RNA binding protein YcfA (HicA-like mRNA interferase family)
MKLPILSARKVIRILEKEGFQILRQKGSHISLYKKTEKKTFLVVVPNKKEIKIGTLIGILKQANFTREEFLNLLKK